jgi:hypothetical protein
MRQRRFGARAGLVGLIAFLAVDVLLVAFALKSTSGQVAGAGTTIGTSDLPAPSSTASTPVPATPSHTSGATPSTTATTATNELAVAPLTVGVLAVDGRTAFRFSTGSCSKGGGTLELTRNGGSSWGPRSAPFDTLTRLRVRSDGSTFAVGANSSGCSPAMREASGYDADWRSATSASGAWYRDPRDPKRIGLRSGGTGRPCGNGAVVDLSVNDSAASVLCANGDVRVSKTGASWNTAATVPGAVAVALGSQSRSYLALPGAGGCAGIAVVDAAAPGTAVGCAAVSLAGVEPGTVALSVSPDSGWLLVGDQAYRAGGTLQTWKKS